ncbi:hypothetical protein [Halobacterium sp. CBA1126]|uniref:DUF7127 family protein n=1 Tax=Halobacterium TaxID=2239 RepID=UPI0012FA3AB8|nr:hypothetical protein [Halobacterium sp. CBA1126]MUV59694.1 hypothetical protein [Halobacterium sp. CBA1126]
MNPKSFTEQLDAPARRFDYDDETVLVADLGVDDDAVSVDVVDDTVIVVVETGDDEPRQHEFDVPAGAVSKALINNGVVTVEVER